MLCFQHDLLFVYYVLQLFISRNARFHVEVVVAENLFKRHLGLFYLFIVYSVVNLYNKMNSTMETLPSQAYLGNEAVRPILFLLLDLLFVSMRSTRNFCVARIELNIICIQDYIWLQFNYCIIIIWH